MLEGLFVLRASGAGVRFVLIKPGVVGCQVALSGTHLVDSAPHELSKPIKGYGESEGGYS